MNNRIKKLRKDQGLTLEAFGARIGVTRAAVSNIENGRSNPSDQLILSICREFGVNEQWLRQDRGEMYPSTSEKQKLVDFMGELMTENSDSFRLRFISVISELDAEGWAFLEKIADELAKKKTDP